MPRISFLRLFLILCSCVPALLPAQNPVTDSLVSSLPRTVTLTDVTVTATAARPETPVTYLDVSAEELAERNLGQDAPYLLKFTPSVVVNSDAGTGIGYTGIWIRGSDPTRTNVTINGIPYNDSESQGVFWVNLPDFSSSADGVQIQRGVGTSVNGAGAFGATIAFNTNQVALEPRLSVDGSVGSFGTRRGKLAYTSGLLDNGLSVEARLSKIHSDGFVDRATADLDGYYLGLGRSGDRSTWRFNAFGGHEVTYQSWNGVTQEQLAEFGRTYNSVGTEKTGEPYDNEVDNYRQNHYQLHFTTELADGTDLRLSGHYTRGLGYFEQYKADQNLANYGITDPDSTTSDLIRRRWLDNHFYGLVYSLRRRWNRLDLTLGGAANEYRGAHYGEVIWARHAGDSEIRDRYYDNDARKQEINTYLRANYRIGQRWNAYADAQLRYYAYDYVGVANDGRPLDQTADGAFFNPKAGLLYDLDGGQAYASFGVAQREPNRNDFTDNPLSSQPRPEKLYNTELGLRRQRGRLNYGVNAYHMLYRDQLVLTGRLNDVGEYTRTNVDRSYRLGLELQGGYRLSDRLTAGGNLTLSRNRVVAFTEFLDDFDAGGQFEQPREDTPLAFSPDLTAAAEITYALLPASERTPHSLEIALQTKYVGDRYVDNSGADASRLDPYAYADLRLSYALTPRAGGFLSGLRLTALVRNLTDAEYESNGWGYRYRADGEEVLLRGVYPQAGRNFLLGLGVDF